MFKRLLSSLISKKNSSTVEPSVADESLIVAYDAYGQQMKIPRNEWRDKVFLPALQQKWNSAADLYSAILSGLEDGFPADLIPAAERLVEIDDIPERAHVIQGIVLMENGQSDAAESTLRAGIAKVGATGTLLTNLAKVFAGRGEDSRAGETLWQAIQADPNQDNGLLWWATLQQESQGEAGYLNALRTAAALPGSWRAQLWLARHHLEQGETEQARVLYREVLAGKAFDAGALMMISGDLGRNGEIASIVELVAPIYDEHQHDPMAGINILRACQELGEVEEGEKLLARMYALGLAPLKQHLDEFAQAFQEMRKQDVQHAAVDPNELQIKTLSLTQPIWHYGLNRADWLFNRKPEDAQKIGFFALSKIVEGSVQSESQLEDNIGRLSRAIPLYFAEAVHYWSHYASSCYIQVVEGKGPILSGNETDGNALFDLVPPTMNYFVTGEIGCSGKGEQEQWQVSLTLWNCAARTKQVSESGQALEAELGSLILDLEQRLLAHVGLRCEQPLDPFYLRPSTEMMGVYLSELGQAFMLTLVANKQIPRSAIWGERAMLEWPLRMALDWPQAEVPKLMYLSGLGKAFDYRSDLVAEYKEQSLALLHDARETNSPVDRLAPLVWKLFDMHDEFADRRQHLSPGADEAYAAWLARLEDK
jgi:tetratricopeptide (TPR) repeat protein